MQAACRHHHRRGADLDGHLLAGRGRGDGVHAAHPAAAPQYPPRAAAGEDASVALPLGVEQEGGGRGLLAAVAAAEDAVAALPVVAAPRVARYRPPAPAELPAAVAQHGIVGVDHALRSLGAEPPQDRGQRAAEALLGEERAAGALRPFVPHRVGKRQRGLPVDGGAAAEGRSRQDGDPQVAGRGHAAVQEQRAHGLELRLIEVRSLPAAACLQHHHPPPGRRQLGRRDAAAGARSDHADLGLESRRRRDHGQPQQRLEPRVERA